MPIKENTLNPLGVNIAVRPSVVSPAAKACWAVIDAQEYINEQKIVYGGQLFSTEEEANRAEPEISSMKGNSKKTVRINNEELYFNFVTGRQGKHDCPTIPPAGL